MTGIWIKSLTSETWFSLDQMTVLRATSGGEVEARIPDFGSWTGLRSFATEAEAVAWIEDLLTNSKES